MGDVLNPVLNAPYVEPTRTFVFDEDGITDQIAERRRPSSFFIPIAPKKKGKQLAIQDRHLDQAFENTRRPVVVVGAACSRVRASPASMARCLAVGPGRAALESVAAIEQNGCDEAASGQAKAVRHL